MVYFIQDVEGGPVKIGTTRDLWARVRQLERDYGCEIAVLKVIAGFEFAERVMHARFDHLRYEGQKRRGPRPELFVAGRELMEFLGLPLFADVRPESVEFVARNESEPRMVEMLIDRASFVRARCVAENRGMEFSDYLTKMVCEPIARDFAEILEATLAMKRDPEGYGSTFV